MARWRKIIVKEIEPENPQQISVFEIPREMTPAERAAEGIREATDAATSDYLRALKDAAREVAKHQDEFTSDDVIDFLADYGVVGNASALGGVIREMKKTGKIEFTGRYKASRRAAAHGKAMRIWRSKIRDNFDPLKADF